MAMDQIDPQAPEAAGIYPVVLPQPFAGRELSYLRWYAVYTRSRHEKCVSRLLEAMSLTTFLPAYESVHRWNDRSAVVCQPIFPGYVFVRICLSDRMQVLSVPGVVNLVGVQGQPCPIPDEEMNSLRVCLERRIRMEPHPYLVVGRRVRIKRGPLAEMEGILVRKKGQFRLVLSVSLITRSVAVEVDAHDVAPVGGCLGAHKDDLSD
jgi:transcription antitermination factor NusG